jgi:cell division protein FtsA
MQSTVTCANRAGLAVTEGVLESVASAEAILTADERDLGVCLLDIGAHSTDLVVFFEGAVAHTASIPIGGQHFTNDLAVGLQMPLALAEELKRQYGNAVVTDVPLHAEIEIANPQPQILRLRRMAEILEPRARELLYFVRESLRQGGVVEALGAGCVLTGGGALLAGMHDVTESHLRVSARTGLPVRLSNMPGELVHPGFSTAVGMLLYAHRTRVNRAAESNGLRSKLRALFAASF